MPRLEKKADSHPNADRVSVTFFSAGGPSIVDGPRYLCLFVFNKFHPLSDLPPKHPRRFWMVKYLVWMFAIALMLLFFVFPYLTTYALQKGYHFKSMSRWLDAIQWLQTFLLHCFVYLWITFLGGCFASFLNVVAWRVPRGRSILGSSHCPHCDVRLSLLDNIPVYGWLNNDGQCRNCNASIAVRYLIVELLLGGVFLLLFLVEVIWGGPNLPLRPEVQAVGIEFLLFTPNWFLIMTFVYHATLICGLFTIAVIASEHKRIPLSVIFFAGIFLVAIASTWPYVIQVPWTAGLFPVEDWPPERFSRASLYTMLIGAASGVVSGSVAWAIHAAGLARLRHPAEESNDPQDRKPSSGVAVAASLGLVGLALGWQSSIWILVLWCICKPIVGRISPARLLPQVYNGCAVVMFATMIHITFWCLQMPVDFWLNE